MPLRRSFSSRSSFKYSSSKSFSKPFVSKTYNQTVARPIVRQTTVVNHHYGSGWHMPFFYHPAPIIVGAPIVMGPTMAVAEQPMVQPPVVYERDSGFGFFVFLVLLAALIGGGIYLYRKHN